MNLKERIKKIFTKAIPLWMVVILILQSTTIFGLFQYYVLKKYINEQIITIAKEKNPEKLALVLRQEVLPQNGYILGVTWSDIGKDLIDAEVIDKQKYEQLFAQDSGDNAMMKYMTHSSREHMMVNEANSHFMVNTLWALGLVNKNNLLDEGQMHSDDPMQFASTGGWSLGSKPTRELYSSQQLIQLTVQQQALVKRIADTMFRPCCDNPTSFPDCNHGMAALGYIELAVKQGVPEKRIYKDVLALNSYWFPQQYVSLATYFTQQKTDWNDVDAKLALSQQYSSAQGASQVQQQLQPASGGNSQGGGCSA